jgi:hypothetical protein
MEIFMDGRTSSVRTEKKSVTDKHRQTKHTENLGGNTSEGNLKFPSILFISLLNLWYSVE